MTWQDRLEQCNRILEMCSEIEGEGREFADSVSEKVDSIATWIEANERCTAKMDDALDNIEAGCWRWLEQ